MSLAGLLTGRDRRVSGGYVGLRRRSLTRRLVLVDAVAVLLAVYAAYLIRFKLADGVEGRVAYGVATVLLAVAWLVTLAWRGAYQLRLLGNGLEEYRRVLASSFWLFAVVGLTSFMLHLDIARLYVGIALPLGVVLLSAGRALLRHRLREERAEGRQLHRVIAVGDASAVTELALSLQPSTEIGYVLVGACIPAGQALALDVPLHGGIEEVASAVTATGADTVAVLSSAELSAARVRELAWQLEGTGADLVLVPALLDVDGGRLAVTSTPGLSLLHLAEPALSGVRWLVKSALDWLLAFALVVALAPLLVGLWLLVRLSSPGPALYRQVRVGADGRLFQVWKLRTMRDGADVELAELLAGRAGYDRLFFKLSDDPRVTPVGRWLRRFSLDELPQLFNVLAGQMSLVGPRPQRPHEVSAYDDAARRRLRVKPGLTGLWQVSGRSTLTPERSIRLDLYYVENWSLSLDLVILARTLRAVLGGRGAC